jgi:hypothetical protein
MSKVVTLVRQKELKRRLDAMVDSLSDDRLRWLFGKYKLLIEEGKMKTEEYDALLEDILQTEMERKMIINELKSGPRTTSEISRSLNFPPKHVFKHLLALKRLNVVAIIGEQDGELEFQLV